MDHEIIPSLSEYESLLKEVRELQARIVELTALRDDLIYHVCPALRAKYEEKIGSIEREILAAKLYLREKQRILEILQAQLNRQEVVSLDDAEEKAGEEFRAYEEDLRRKAEEQEAFRKRWQETQWEEHDRRAEEEWEEQQNTSDSESDESPDEDYTEDDPAEDETGKGPDRDGTDEGARDDAGSGSGEDSCDGDSEEDGSSFGCRARNPVEALKRLYRKIVKRLHPDVHPEQTEREKALFNEATAAYEAGDLNRLQAVWEELESGTDPEERFEDTPEDLKKLRELLKSLRLRVQILSGEIAHIRSDYPYTMKDFLEDEAAVEKRRGELKKQLQEIREADAKLAEFIEMVRKKMKEPRHTN